MALMVLLMYRVCLLIKLILLLLVPYKLSAGQIMLDDRLRVKESDLFYHHTALSYKAIPRKLLSPFAGIRFIQQQGSEWNYFTRFFLGVNLAIKQLPGTLNLTSAFEFRPGNMLGSLDTSDELRFRQRFLYKFPFTFSALQLTPIVFDELFFRASDNFQYYNNRLGLGFNGKIGQHFRPSISYYRAFQKSKGWQSDGVIELVFKVFY